MNLRRLLKTPSLAAFTICTALLASGCSRSDAETRNLQVPFDQILSFAAAALTGQFRRSGWAVPEQAFTWTDGNSAELRFVLPRTNGPVGVRMRLTGFFKAPDLPAQLVQVSANGTMMTEWRVAATADFSFVVPHDLLREDGRLDIKLELPRAASPKSLGVSEDHRILGVRCSEIEVTRAVVMSEIWPNSVVR